MYFFLGIFSYRYNAVFSPKKDDIALKMAFDFNDFYLIQNI
jgi:hypothetical protein